MTLDRQGRIYFTDLGGSAVYRIDPSGTLTRILAASEVQRPNGIQISPDDTKLYVADSFPPPGTGSGATQNTGIHVVSPQGKLLRVMPIPEDPITNNAFGGPDMKTLYVTAGKTLYRLRNETAGLPR